LRWKETNKYDSAGNLIEKTKYNQDGSLNSKTFYKYDSRGNRVEKTVYKGESTMPERQTVYEITYRD
jgi:hypothetical protein